MRVQSKNFTLVGNASEKDIRRAGAKLEQFRDVFSRLFPAARLSAPAPTTVMVFKNDSSFKPYKPLYKGKPANVAGYFQSGEDVNYITLAAANGYEDPFRVIFHEYTHLLVSNTVKTPPAWFNEGLAEYYSTFEVRDDQKAYLGTAIANHVLLLRERFIPLRDLFAVDHGSELYNEREKQSIFYAESWAVMHYLLVGNDGKRRAKLSEFLAAIFNGAEVEQAFTKAFEIDYRSFEKELRNYVNRNAYMAQVFTFERKLEFDAEMRSTPIGEAEALAYLGDLLLHTNRVDDAIVTLNASLAADAQQPMAHASLGVALMRQQKYAEAKEHLERASSLNSQNYLPHYYYAYVLSRENRREGQLVYGYPADKVAAMRTALKKSIELRQDFAESYHLLAFINLVVEEQIDDSIKLMRTAIRLSPGRDHYTSVLAQLYLRKQDTKTARQLMEPLARNSSDPSLRNFAENLLKQIDSFEQMRAAQQRQHELAVNSPASSVERSTNSAPLADDRPTLTRRSAETPEQEQARLETDYKKAAADALREALRKPAPGEEQIGGNLIGIECGAQAVVLVVQSATGSLRLNAKNFESINFISYTDDVSGELRCGARRPPSPVVATFKRTTTPTKNKIDGEVTGIDFVPKDFSLK